MRKFLCAILFIALSTAAIAQTKGDKYISFAISGSLGQAFVEYFNGSSTQSASAPSDTDIAIQGEFAYFVSNHFRLSFAVGLPYHSTPTEKASSVWLRDNSSAITINPNAAYYYKIADGIYYTPELGLSLGFGNRSVQESASSTTHLKTTTWELYLQYLSFEFRVNERLALGFAAGTLSYGGYRYNDANTAQYVSAVGPSLSLNNGALFVRFYL